MLVVFKNVLAPIDFEELSDNGKKMHENQQKLIASLIDVFGEYAESIMVNNLTFVNELNEANFVNAYLRLRLELDIGYTASIIYLENMSYGSETLAWEIMFWKTSNPNYEDNKGLLNNAYPVYGNDKILETIHKFSMDIKGVENDRESK